ncbi:MAG: hypothetical protein R3B74_15635 [Nitrospirales bacterium]|nr:hypothetical protein [Nitrospirales bacterium]
MPTIKLTLEYEGTAYAGWQQQPHQSTIQGHIEQALFQITQHRIPLIGAGRTDAGVHALGQVASFQSDKILSPVKWAQALNRYLPTDIAVLQSEQVADSFHARYSAEERFMSTAFAFILPGRRSTAIVSGTSTQHWISHVCNRPFPGCSAPMIVLPLKVQGPDPITKFAAFHT